MQTNNDVIIVGGGLAGLTCAIHLSNMGFSVLLVEKNTYPHHKVCGEYVSNEVLPYLQSLGADPLSLGPQQLSKLMVTTLSGRSVSCDLPLGGFGISRYKLDDFLYQKAKLAGASILTDTVSTVRFENDGFVVSTKEHGEFGGRLAIGAYGKRAALDQQLSRPFIRRPSPWLAVKAHYSGKCDSETVALHHFRGGYCGVSKVEDGRLNICYLADYNSFKKFKNIAAFNSGVLHQNRHLKDIFQHAEPLFDQPLSISQISFDRKEPVWQHMLMVGDTAGLIHPLCGNGMAMAIHGAKICSELCTSFFRGELSRQELETAYDTGWKRQFGRRLRNGHLLSRLARKEKLFDMAMSAAVSFPPLLPYIVKQTHGKPF
ncbi:NAD(P)/FAD-dependent oxidoreductase [Pedobacter deserti]|uniref:NAD(P)/FAD-dependent oxidoreductase n=1 Tax=Pedobacter deserti TaxID=2817382 RepID=UPI00210DFCF7|nr:NAD(P)/FAD-dependent oxidoreductase [Pedobacter sp. SYSU D00382]